MKRSIALLTAALAAMGGAQASDATLSVTVNGIRHDRGEVSVSLYSDPKTFRKEAQAVAVKRIPAAPGRATVAFDGLAPGRYAIMVYHDEDGDGELDRRLGMFPTEGYGLSNNPTVIGPPAFEDSAFEVATQKTGLSIALRY